MVDIAVTSCLAVLLCLSTARALEWQQQQLLSSGEGTKCPPWMTETPSNNTRTTCKCLVPDRNNGIAECTTDNSLKLQACYCVSYHSELNMTVYGNCLYSCTLKHDRIIKPDEINATCDKFNRMGEQCSKCKNGTGHPLYSYSMQCVRCEGLTGYFKYAAVAFLPLTAFYLIVVAFRISATSELLSGYVLMSQIVTTPSQLRYMKSFWVKHTGTKAIATVISAHAIWNLDFFRALYEPFCIHESMSTMLVESLEYIIALYPLLLIALTYFLVYLHDKYPVVAHLWGPLHRLFARMRRHWNIRKSLVDAFATFLLLSYIKILNASFNILLPTHLYNFSGNLVSNQYLYYDGGTRIFHGKHIPYSLLAMAMTLIFNIAPLLMLLLYPSKHFQRRLNCCQFSRFQVFLHTLMDSFQGYYRMSPLDCRYFAAINLIARIANLIIYSATLNRYYYPFGCILFIAMAGLTTVARPYKSSRQNTTDVVLYLLFALGYLSATAYALSPDHTYSTVLIVFMSLTGTLSVIYMLALLLYFSVPKSLLSRIRDISFRLHASRGHRKTEGLDEELFESLKERDETRPLLNQAQKKQLPQMAK